MMMRKLSLFVLCLTCLPAFAQQSHDFVVAPDGKGDFKTVQDAIDAVPDFRKNTTTILIHPGTYKEKLVLPASKTNVSFVGLDREQTILTFDDYASKKNRFGEEMGTTGSASFYIFGEGFSATNITFQNSAGPVGQAVAVRIDADKVTFTNCRFLGFQDTLYAYGENSRQYYKDCYIEGTVDFIFGWSTAFFENCTIFCKKPGGYITAASTMEGTQHGFVFVDCKISGDADAATFYLGRPWRPFAKTVFIRCNLGALIKPEGWHNWKKPEAEATTFYSEYESTGPGANGPRVAWSHVLSDAEAAKYTRDYVLGDWTLVVKR
jgi:pectinesterase